MTSGFLIRAAKFLLGHNGLALGPMRDEPKNSSFIPAQQTRLAFDQLWSAVRTCELNVIFHRKKAKHLAKQERWLEITATLLGAIAGIGILSGIKGIHDSVWAVIAFFSGIVGQLRSVFRLPDKMLEHRRLQNDYGSVLSQLKGMVSRAQDAGGLTPEIHSQLQLTLERFRVTDERDETDYKPDETRPIEEEVGKMYPEWSLWIPQYALQLDSEERHERSSPNTTLADPKR